MSHHGQHAHPEHFVHLSAQSNQALGIGHYAVAFMSAAGAAAKSGASRSAASDAEPQVPANAGPGAPAPKVLERTNMFHVDATLCGLSALALGTNAPTILRDEALTYAAPLAAKGHAGGPVAREPGGRTGAPHPGRTGATVFGSDFDCMPEKAICANSSAVREWDSNGTNFGYNPSLGHTAGEFGHNDFYPVAIAAAQQRGLDGAAALRAMVMLDEIRGRLAEVFSLKTFKIDHVLHGAIASAATYGAMMGATAEQIESAIGMVVAHHVPFRAIRHGKQLSDSKGASAAISTEAAILCMRRSMAGFIGPKDIFRNAEAVFCLFQNPPEKGMSPFNLSLAREGDDFAVMGMHFKLGLYEHQSAGAHQALLNLLARTPALLAESGARIAKLRIVAYEPAYSIIGDPAKMDPRTRQSADHSMAYIIATLLHKCIRSQSADWAANMLLPHDYNPKAIADPLTRHLMQKIEFVHGGADYDRKYPEGIPTSMVITDDQGKEHDSGLVMFPAGHARNTDADLRALLHHKWTKLGALAFDKPGPIIQRFEKLESKSAAEIAKINDFEVVVREKMD
ncbi:hypothetical protein BH11PLA1_BH11PLA1_05860 [soil metagenome]